MKFGWLALLILIVSGCASHQPNGDPYDSAAPMSHEDVAADSDTPMPGYEPPKTVAEAIARGDAALLQANKKMALFEYAQGLTLVAKEDGDQEKPALSAQDKADLARLYSKLAELNFEIGNLDSALKSVKASLELEPNSIRGHELAGILYLKKRNYDLAKSYFNDSIALDNARLKSTEITNQPDVLSPYYAYTGLGLIADLEKQSDLAEENFNKAILVRPNSPQSYTNLAYSYYLQGDYVKAQNLNQRALSLNNSYKPAWRNLGMLYIVQGHEIEGLRAFMRIEEDYQAYNDVGYLYQVIGNTERASFFFNKAIDTAPHYYTPAYNNLKNQRMGISF